MGATGARNFWYEYKTPLLVKGKYKLWVCYRTGKQSGTIGQPGGSNNPIQVSFNGVDLSRVFNFVERRPNLSDGEMEALGWKRYTDTLYSEMAGRFVGTIDVPVTDRHTIRMRSLAAAGTGQDVNYLDMVHIIPVNMNQYLPRFKQNGTKVFF
jgi:hypothetical protein